MSDNMLSLLVTVAVGYLLWKHFSKKGPRQRFGVLNGGRDGQVLNGQFRPADRGAPPQVMGGTPEIAVVSWPGDGRCPC